MRGTVQGVGFRPFVHRLATRHDLVGWVLNHSRGVAIEVEGPAAVIDAFLQDLRGELPPLAHVETLDVAEAPPTGGSGFEIRASRVAPGESQPVPPDTATCADCLRELWDPADRRYRYPFVNCTNCGPRFTIIEALPYDRPNTTMWRFTMCAACAREYHDPTDRRFHAQPVACPACGPRLALVHAGQALPGDPLAGAVALLRAGQILALKALGGFHLACDARDEAAVGRLRERKRRGAKPFAVMFADLEALRAVCEVSPAEAALLTSPARPIVLVRWRTPLPPAPISPAGGKGERGYQGLHLAPSVAPGLAEVGVMLPSTPLHHLLLHDFGGPLVMTSGNLSEEPIAAENEEAMTRLARLADAFLVHDRPIASRYDDSVARVFQGAAMVVRRARGYAPSPLALPFTVRRPVLACGAHLKSTFCLVRDQHAYLSQHVGDLENLETLEHFQATLALYQRLFAVRPALVAHDLHPEYLSTRLALSLDGVERVAVQHHHAHVVSCLAEHGVSGPAIGVAYDGLGYGADGHLWGGELLIADWQGFVRRAHLREAPLPGGDGAIRKPYRMALGYLGSWFATDLAAFAPFLDRLDAAEVRLILQQVARGLNAPPTSSCGRLFDAVAALLGIRAVAQYEGQAAIELQAVADPGAEGSYPYDVGEQADCWVVDPAPLLWAAYRDHRTGVAVATIAMRVHRTVADFTVALCRRLAAESGLRQVALSGGVFQNTLLLGEVVTRLHAVGLDTYYQQRVPSNDGGLSLGQAVVAHASRGGQ